MYILYAACALLMQRDISRCITILFARNAAFCSVLDQDKASNCAIASNLSQFSSVWFDHSRSIEFRTFDSETGVKLRTYIVGPSLHVTLFRLLAGWVTQEP